MRNIRNKNKEVVYLLQDLTKKINISFFDPLDTIEYKLNDFTLTELYYLIENVLYPILKYKKDNIIIENIILNTFDQFNNHFNQYIKNDTQMEEIKIEIVKITAKYLSKHLDKLYDNLISSRFMDYYQKGWIGIYK